MSNEQNSVPFFLNVPEGEKGKIMVDVFTVSDGVETLLSTVTLDGGRFLHEDVSAGRVFKIRPATE